MTNTTVRQIRGDEVLETMHWLPAYAFQSSPPLPDKAEYQETLKQRKDVLYFALFEDDRSVSCAASTRMRQNVRGALYGAGAIWDVVTHPAARRRGYSRRVLACLLGVLREEGRVFACLYPFRESFYQRLGYVTFPLPLKARFEPSTLSPLLKQDLGGEVELVLAGDGYDAYRDYVLKLQRCVHGWGVFEKGDRAGAQRNRWWLALAKVDGETVGLMTYDLRGDSVTEFKFRAIRFYYDASRGRYLLLQWIARHVDQANQVELWLAPYELPETWLADMRVSVETAVRAPMGRVIDVASLGRMHTGPGRFAARVADPLCPWNEGLWRFETVDGALQVNRVDQADCDLNIQGVSALVYGTHDPGDFDIRGWGDPSLQVQETMRAMFPPMRPHLHEYF
jgi:GNAT superfamily N-acetyltransferase